MNPQEILKEPNYAVTAFLKQTVTLAPFDSLHRVIDVLRYAGSEAVPVIDGSGNLLGVMDSSCLTMVLDGRADSANLAVPVSTVMRQPRSFVTSNMNAADIAKTLRSSGEASLPVLDHDQKYIGMVSVTDLLMPVPIRARPPRVGGMATPWGVYLTTGSIQAGVGNVALLGSGMLMGLMLVVATCIVVLASAVLRERFGLPVYSLWKGGETPHLALNNVTGLDLQFMILPVFLFILRSLPLAGYHAAEHQAVHAMERGEELMPEIVKRMPRVHPRCGTNIMAAALVFISVMNLMLATIRGVGPEESALVGALVTMFTWRGLGALLQQYFTTKPANHRQIVSGIAAAEDLQRKYLFTEPRRPNILRRIWCMGMVQMMVGSTVVGLGAAAAFNYIFP